MRNLSDSQDFILQTEKFLQKCFITSFSSEVLSRIAPSALGENFENSYRISVKTQTNLVLLSLISWYLPEESGILLRLSIEEEIRNTDLDFLALMLENKGQCLCFLLETSLWSTRDWFGNLLTLSNLKTALGSLKPSLKSRRKPKRIQRHRGYRDKGTLRKESDKHDLWTSTAEQMKLEEERLSNAQTLEFLVGWIT